MTREEAIEFIAQSVKSDVDMAKVANAIRALEQDSILGKIRAEIDQKQYDFMADKDYDEGIRFGLMLAYQIIDKYKAEDVPTVIEATEIDT